MDAPTDKESLLQNTLKTLVERYYQEFHYKNLFNDDSLKRIDGAFTSGNCVCLSRIVSHELAGNSIVGNCFCMLL
jgi:hypothetical protein